MVRPSSWLIYRKAAFYMSILYKANFFVVQPSSRLVIAKLIFFWTSLLPGCLVQSEYFYGSAFFPASYCEIYIFMDQPSSRLPCPKWIFLWYSLLLRLVIAKLIFLWTSLFPAEVGKPHFACFLKKVLMRQSFEGRLRSREVNKMNYRFSYRSFRFAKYELEKKFLPFFSRMKYFCVFFMLEGICPLLWRFLCFR